MKLKRIISATLAVVVLVGLLPIQPASAATNAAMGANYVRTASYEASTYTSAGEDKVAWAFPYDGNAITYRDTSGWFGGEALLLFNKQKGSIELVVGYKDTYVAGFFSEVNTAMGNVTTSANAATWLYRGNGVNSSGYGSYYTGSLYSTAFVTQYAHPDAFEGWWQNKQDTTYGSRAYNEDDYKKIVADYITSSIFAAYRMWLPSTSGFNGNDNMDTYFGEATGVDVLANKQNEMQVYVARSTGSGNEDENEEVLLTPVTISTLAKNSEWTSDPLDIVNSVFDSTIASIIRDPGDDSSDALTEEQIGQLIFCLLYVHRPYDISRYSAYLKSPAQQKLEKRQSLKELAGSKPGSASHTYQFYRWAGYIFSETDASTIAGRVEQLNSMLGSGETYAVSNWGTEYAPQYTGSGTTYTPTINGDMSLAQAFGSVAYFTDYWRNIDNYNVSASTGSTSNKGAAYAQAWIQIQEQFNSLDASNNLFQQSSKINDRVLYWSWRTQLAAGLALGTPGISAETVQKFDWSKTTVVGAGILPDNTLFPYNAKLSEYNQQAVILYMASLQELADYGYILVDALAPNVTNNNKSFAAVRNEIEAMRTLYEFMSLFNDNNLWEAWNSKAFDHRLDANRERIPESERISLADIYNYLVVNNAFEQLTGMDLDASINQSFAYFFHLSQGSIDDPDYVTPGLSTSLITGIEVSASFIPMHTNVYDPYTWKDAVDTEWLLNYYAKFGYFRKALYIDTGADAAVNYVNTGGRGTLAVATLEDILQDRDIVLYLDDNLYNVDDLAELIDMSWDRLGQDEQSSSLGMLDSWGDAITSLWEVKMPELAKTAERTTYSDRVPARVSADAKWDGFFLKNMAEKAETAKPVQNAGSTGEEGENPEEGSDTNFTDTTQVQETYTSTDDAGSIEYYLWPDHVWDSNAGGVPTITVGVGDDAQQVAASRTTEYTPLFSFAVLSAIYRNSGLRNSLNGYLSRNIPVFMSSVKAPYVSSDYVNIIYNYMYLRNLEAQMTVDYATSLDMTSPLYMDIFGNILTESGYVVVPAATNASLWRGDYVIQNAGFCSTYGDAFYLPVSSSDMDFVKYPDAQYRPSNVYKALCVGQNAYFSVVNGVYVMNTLYTVDGSVDASRLSTASKDSLRALTQTFSYSLRVGTGMYNLNTWIMITTEVLRGAPIEYIDKQFEGIQTNMTYTRNGLIIADKLDTLVAAIAPAGQNASLVIPNPAYMDGIEIIVFFVYKILILAVLVIWMVNIYLDAVGGHIGLRTGAKCIGTVVLVLALVVGVPRIFELTYYESNKLLLQSETEYLMMLNLEKKENGEEIGVSKVTIPETNTKLYLYLSDVEIPWWNLLSNLALSAGYHSLDEMYQQYENQHPLAYSDRATTMNGRIYISTDDLFESARIQFSPLSDMLYVRSSEGSLGNPASYYTPYYYFLEVITDTISDWSKANNAIAYTTKVQRGGELKTLGYCKMFFESEDFMEEGPDYFRLYDLYGVLAPRQYQFPTGGVPSDTYDILRNSQWCPYNANISDTSLVDRIERLNRYAQMWIAENRGMIGKVTDETFIKCFALSCAMEHNRLFNTQRADYLEIQELSNEDLLRLSIANHNDVMANSSMSYARFVYTQGGTIAVYLAAFLELVNFVSSWVKPICTLVVFLIACCSIFVLKLILRRGNNSVFGYIITIALMCSVNLLGSLFYKLSMYIPSFGLSTSVCILILILVQLAYIIVQFKIVSFALRDWRNVGFQRYEHAYNKLHIGRRSRQLSRDVDTPRQTYGYEYLNRLTQRQDKRRIRA